MSQVEAMNAESGATSLGKLLRDELKLTFVFRSVPLLLKFLPRWFFLLQMYRQGRERCVEEVEIVEEGSNVMVSSREAGANWSEQAAQARALLLDKREMVEKLTSVWRQILTKPLRINGVGEDALLLCI